VFEAEFFQVEAVDEGVDEPDWILLFYVLVDGIWKKHCLASVGACYMFAHGFSTALSGALKPV
jgi:hypothetical protein